MTHKTGRSLSFYFYFIACFMVLSQGFTLAAPKYPLPQYLIGTTSQQDYDTWLENKSVNILKKDRRRNRACALHATLTMYKQAIHAAVNAAGLPDPYTGDTMKWELIGTWKSTKGKDWPEGYIKRFYLMPTVDHIDPDADSLALEICSWRINESKSSLTPQEFIEVCGRVASFK